MLIVGLGNPGKEYTETRHNAGFMAVDEIIRRYDLPAPLSKYKGQFTKGEIAGEKVFLLKPDTFMNRSGISVAEVVKFYKIPLSEVLVIHDELDFPVGKLRIKKGGGAGGHNGLKSLDSHIGKDYRRLRVGIDHPGDKDKVHSYVLQKFKKSEREQIDHLIALIAEHTPLLIAGDDINFMNKIAL